MNPKEVLRGPLPTLVAFKRIFRMERRHNVAYLNGAAQNVQAVVGRGHQFDVLHHRPGATCAQLKQVGLVPVAKLGPPQVGAAMADGQVTQNARRTG